VTSETNAVTDMLKPHKLSSREMDL